MWVWVWLVGYSARHYRVMGEQLRTILWKCVNVEDLKCEGFCATSSAKEDGYVVQEIEHSHPPYQEEMASTSGVSNSHTNSNPMTTPTPRETTLNRPIGESINVFEFNEQGKKILVQKGYKYIDDFTSKRTIFWRCVNFEDLKCEGYCATSSAKKDGYVVQESKHSHPPYQEKMASISGDSNSHTNSNTMTTPTPRKMTLNRPIAESINVFEVNEQGKKILVQSGYKYIGDFPRKRTIVWKWVNFEDLKCEGFCATSSAKKDGYVVQESKHSHPPYQEKMASISGDSNSHTNSNPMTTPTPRKTTLNRPTAESINVAIAKRRIGKRMVLLYSIYFITIYTCEFLRSIPLSFMCSLGDIIYVRTHNHPDPKQVGKIFNHYRFSRNMEFAASVSKSLTNSNPMTTPTPRETTLNQPITESMNIGKRHVVDEKGYIYSYCPGNETLKWECIYYKKLNCEGYCKTSTSRKNGITLFYCDFHLHSHNHPPGSEEIDVMLSHNQLREKAFAATYHPPYQEKMASTSGVSNSHTNSNPMSTPTPRETTLNRPIAESINVCEGFCKTSSPRMHGDIIYKHGHNHPPGSAKIDVILSHNQLREKAFAASVSDSHTNSNPMSTPTPSDIIYKHGHNHPPSSKIVAKMKRHNRLKEKAIAASVSDSHTNSKPMTSRVLMSEKVSLDSIAWSMYRSSRFPWSSENRHRMSLLLEHYTSFNLVPPSLYVICAGEKTRSTKSETN
ncbi:hypothetical protein KQX54_007804 [Cotesia glomerata]|uniref:FLYWCH-type domain-containing protein n=1 Tax=Cotesia glomerata TaxID=32391 RepID=A0AAV7HIH6_COTGL|nr:hypothetical protein KQX54_007804 [Cotesia glomerata]